MENKFEATNNIEIIGILEQANKFDVQTSRSGDEYVSGTAVVSCTFDDAPNSFEISFYAKRFTKDGAESKLFESYVDLPNMIGKTIQINGSIREDRYANKTTGQLASSQRLDGRFVKAVASETPHKAEFVFGGFVRKNLVELTRKDGSIYAYELEVAQTNYNGSMMNNYKFHIDPSQKKIIDAIRSIYTLNTTIHFGGDLRFVVTTTTKTLESAFGAPRVQTYTNITRNYLITWGDNPIVGEEAYTPEAISQLISAYAARDVELASELNANGINGGAAPISSRQSSLI